MQEILQNKSPCHLFSSYSFTGILKLKYQNFCLEKQGCQGMAKVGKRPKKKPTVLQLLREAPEGMGIGDTLVSCG